MLAANLQYFAIIPAAYAVLMLFVMWVLIYLGRKTFDIDKQFFYLAAIIAFVNMTCGIAVAIAFWFALKS